MASTERPLKQLSLIPYGDDPLERLAGQLLADHRARLPRLDEVTVLIPDPTEAPRLRRLLLAQAAELGYNALLGPRIESVRGWLAGHDNDNHATCSDYRRELILLQALREHSALFGEGNLWALADSLLTLFDELTLSRVGLPENLDEFTQRVAAGYGFHHGQLEALEREAHLVHTLWHAWHEELSQRGLMDRNTRYLLQLGRSLNDHTEAPDYLLLPPPGTEAERLWLATILKNSHLRTFVQGHYSAPPEQANHPAYPLQRLLNAISGTEPTCQPTSALGLLLDTVYALDGDLSLSERAATFARLQPDSPLANCLQVFSADSDEEEALAVELQVRRWLLAGQRRVGIVTENRRLARRVRALLERAGIVLEDEAGWALSTTSAAATLERWLQCIEEDFPHTAMLDLLKSPFFYDEARRETHLAEVFRLEQDIVLREKIGSGLARYLQQLRFRQRRLPNDLAEGLEPVAELLRRLEAAAEPLRQRLAEKSDAAELLGELIQSLHKLGIAPQLGVDEAGMRLLEEMQKMRQSAGHEPLTMDWLEFRNWLERSFERYSFQPRNSAATVTLTALASTALARFDALIIAGMERDYLPGTPGNSPFFNDGVRRELGLPVADEQLSQRFYLFRRLLESAPQLLITHRRQNNGEEIPPSPWLELLQAFHQLAYGHGLHATILKRLILDERTRVVRRERPLPQQEQRPSPALPLALLPSRYSASAYQQLIDCPYQFFAARGLGLAAPETIREALEKSDYGERVHLCLQAMHSDISNLPGPYTGNWVPARRDAAIRLLQEISHAVFAHDLEDNFLHRGWLQRWLEKIPAYIDWQLERAEQWDIQAVEQKLDVSGIEAISLHGRLDRCDRNVAGQLGIVDYKTGKFARDEQVLSGEAVQLPFYALLAADTEQSVERVEYLALDEKKVESKSILEGETLMQLSQTSLQRLSTLQNQMESQHGLPAWGDRDSCKYCSMSGLCRRQAWDGA